MKKPLIPILTVLAVLVVLFFVMGPFYILEEGNQAVVTQFGEVVATETEAGLHFKLPMVQTVAFFPKRLMSWDGNPQRLPTQENQFIWVDATARWRITDLAKYYESITYMERAYSRLDDIIDPAIRRVIATNPLMEAVRSSNIINELETVAALEAEDIAEDSELANLITVTRNYDNIRQGRRELSNQMLDSIRDIAQNEYGIEILDIVIRQIRYSDDLTQSVYQRMITERAQIAQGLRSDGEGQKLEILGQTQREERTIISEAFSRAEEIRGTADAEAADIYARAYNQDRDFFEFWRSIESYRNTMPTFNKTLSTDMDYFRFLYSPRGTR